MLTLLRSLVINKLDFCDSVMAGAPDVLLIRLPNAGVRLVFSARKYDHTTLGDRSFPAAAVEMRQCHLNNIPFYYYYYYYFRHFNLAFV